MANDSGLLRWTLCILREIDTEIDSGLLKWTLCILREIDTEVDIVDC